MLVNPEEAQEQEAQKYETMQCFTVSEPKSIKEEGEGEKTRLTNPIPHTLFTQQVSTSQELDHKLLFFSCIKAWNNK